MKILSQTTLISACIVLTSFSVQATDNKKQSKSACDLINAKSMSLKQISSCKDNAKGKEKSSWIEIFNKKRVGRAGGDGSI